jgi:inorganic triphosphatase YgiF
VQRATASFNEIELEQLSATGKVVARLESALLASGAEPTNGAGPLEEALARERTRAAAAVDRARAAPLLSREQYAQMLAHDPGVRVGDDPEDLHQLRVATRRLRSVLKTAAPILDATWVSEMRDELAWLGGELGFFSRHRRLDPVPPRGGSRAGPGPIAGL